jgi:hypothetical protein
MEMMVGAGTKGPPKPGFNLKFSDPKNTPLAIDVVESPAPNAYDLKVTK